MTLAMQTTEWSKMHWYEKWFDANYLKLYRHRNVSDAKKQVKLIIDTLRPKKDASILDLCCGAGRHCMLLHEMGYEISGLDLSELLVAVAKEEHPDLNLFVGDMRSIPGRYDIILSLFTSFGYFETDEENERVIESVGASLNNGGWYWLDFLNPDHLRKTLVPETVTDLSETCRVIEKRQIVNRTVVKDIRFVGDDCNEHYEERVRLYTREDLEAMFSKHGILPKDAFGDYDGAPWRPDSERTILYGRKE